METTLSPKKKQKAAQNVTEQSIDKFVQEIEERPFVYLGHGHWYSRQTDCVYKKTNGKLEFVANYRK